VFSGVKDTTFTLRLTKNDASTKDKSNPPLIDSDYAFPLYVVGPATGRALTIIIDDSRTSSHPHFSQLNPQIFGHHTGNGDALAKYILHHYNTQYSHYLYTFYEAPRLPFTPLIGPYGPYYGYRCERNDPRLRRKPLLFLVGEQRRDIIPKTLMSEDLPEIERIGVEEIEVYKTVIRDGFEQDFKAKIQLAEKQERQVVVVVVFSPQGCEAMLRCLGFIDEDNKMTAKANDRWNSAIGMGPPKYIIATIGPTTRDYLKRTFDFDADVCAAKPSPEGVADGVWGFLRRQKILAGSLSASQPSSA
jgi:uroporphyrinogen-III synthase